MIKCSTRKQGPITHVVDASGKPVEITLRLCKTHGAVVRTEKGAHLIVHVGLSPLVEVLRQVDDLAPTTGTPLDRARQTLLVKLPCKGRRGSFQCKFYDTQGCECTSYDITAQAPVEVSIRFGGVWPDGSGYSWFLQNLRLQ